MSFHSIPPLNPIEILNKLSQSTLVIPVISIGNIPQLSTDLLIHNLKCHLIARLDDDYLYPFISPVDYVESGNGSSGQQVGISTSLEVYYNDDLKITILQQRSPILPHFQNKFLKELLIPFITSIQFSSVMILNSSTPKTSEVGVSISKPLRLYSNNLAGLFTKINLEEDTPIESTTDFESFSSSYITTLVKSLTSEEAYSEPLQQSPSEVNLVNQLKENFPTSLPLSRVSSSLQQLRTNPLSVMILSISSYEGDNSQDAKLLTRELLKILNIKNEEDNFKMPKSWEGFYGSRDIPVGIEGLYS